ncbi:MAG: carbon-nitrogen hydrolase family protein [Paracoccaceae bacterium]|nr:carbon-nitrogen hydrolase family protein [Paracoccaceae bacterium]
MRRLVHIACLQTQPKPDFEAALAEALDLAAIAVDQGAQVLFLPEYCGGLRTKGGMFAPPALPESSHPVLTGLRGFAQVHDVWISVGSVAVPSSAGKVINRSFLLDCAGAVVSRYDKLHLFDIQLSDHEVYRESARVTPGKQCVVSRVDWAVIGHSICYDLRFPNLYRDMAQAGAEILVVPSAFTKKTGQAHWHVLNRARAIENGAFVVSTCAVGLVEGGGEAYGHSLIINPWGEVVADAGGQRGVVHATIDLDEVVAARGKIPSLQHDKPYSKAPVPTEDVA